MSEPAQVFSTKEVKARKNHKCCECYEEIKKGDMYQCSKGIWDEPASYKQCVNCSEIFLWACYEDQREHGEGVGFTALSEWFFAYACVDFNGVELLNSFAKQIGIEPEKLNLLLKIDLNTTESE